MMLAYRPIHPLVSKPPALSAGTRVLIRPSTPVLAGILIVAAAFAGLTAARLVRVERDYLPALSDARQLGATLDATRALLRDTRLGSTEGRIARADSLAERFHHIATDVRRSADERAAMLAYDATFGEYFVAARRAAAGTSMSDDADGSSAELANLTYRMLRENLDAGIDARELAVESGRTAMAPLELAAWIALALVAAGALFRQLMVSPSPAAGSAVPVQAEGDRSLPIPDREGSTGLRLQDAVARMARARLASSVAAARVAARNNQRQIELARSWDAPTLSLMSVDQPTAELAEMAGYDEPATREPNLGHLTLMRA